VKPYYQTDRVTLYHGDCLEVLPTLAGGSVDLIATDLPYGVTQCKWDSIIPLEKLWELCGVILKRAAAFITTCQQPFTTTLIASNQRWFRYCLVWDKQITTGFLDANRRPLRRHEDIAVFCKERTTYNPQKASGNPYVKPRRALTESYGNYQTLPVLNETGDRFPTTIVNITNANRNKNGHPTQKPVELMAYLIATYSNPYALVLDPCCGSGTTGVACSQLGRKFIGIEKEERYCETASKRLAEAEKKEPLWATA